MPSPSVHSRWWIYVGGRLPFLRAFGHGHGQFGPQHGFQKVTNWNSWSFPLQEVSSHTLWSHGTSHRDRHWRRTHKISCQNKPSKDYFLMSLATRLQVFILSDPQEARYVEADANSQTTEQTVYPPMRIWMETLAAIIPSLRKGLWTTLIDLKDAYLCVPIHSCHQRFLSFNYDQTDFVFQAIPFRLLVTPHVFTQITRAVTSFLRPQGITVFAYLDKRLIVSPSSQRYRLLPIRREASNHQIFIKLHTLPWGPVCSPLASVLRSVSMSRGRGTTSLPQDESSSTSRHTSNDSTHQYTPRQNSLLSVGCHIACTLVDGSKQSSKRQAMSGLQTETATMTDASLPGSGCLRRNLFTQMFWNLKQWREPSTIGNHFSRTSSSRFCWTIPPWSRILTDKEEQGLWLCAGGHTISSAEGINDRIRAPHLARKENVLADALSRRWQLDQKEDSHSFGQTPFSTSTDASNYASYSRLFRIWIERHLDKDFTANDHSVHRIWTVQ